MTATASRTTNRRPELLAPAGGPEPFAAALAAGADAIYCGMGSFNARRKATNFTDEAFEQACRAAHLAGRASTSRSTSSSSSPRWAMRCNSSIAAPRWAPMPSLSRTGPVL
ncbi:MAG: hypothetical protein ACLS89_02570 [Collinsella sp.]